MWEHGSDVARVNSYVVFCAINRKAHSHSNQNNHDTVGGSFSWSCHCTKIWKDSKSCCSCNLPKGASGPGKVSKISYVPQSLHNNSEATPMNTRWKLGYPIYNAGVFCRHKQMKAKIDEAEHTPYMLITQRICAFYNVNLCANCFSEYCKHE